MTRGVKPAGHFLLFKLLYNDKIQNIEIIYRIGGYYDREIQ